MRTVRAPASVPVLERHVPLSSTLYRVRESFPDAPSALARACAIMRDLADWQSIPWPQLEPVTTAEQYAHALRSFDTALMVADREPGACPFLDELCRRGVVTIDAKQPKFWFAADLRLRLDLADPWSLLEGLILTLNSASPFGGAGIEPVDDCTEGKLDGMVSAPGLSGPGDMGHGVDRSHGASGGRFTTASGDQLGTTRCALGVKGSQVQILSPDGSSAP
jgi:hypothetical protein